MFCLIAWWGIASGTMANYIVTGYVWKVLIEIAVLPATYRLVAFIRKRKTP
ncbi:MAG: hypothetical protein LBC29_00890 [Propionibacteriaceae bacterium]|nr:hypothetical protein [Propionibacteriaceae bacterium]